MVHNPELRAQPVGVRQKSLLVTTNYVARALGVPKMIKVSDAKQKFPDLVIIDGECLDSYREVLSRAILFPSLSISHHAQASEDIFAFLTSQFPQVFHLSARIVRLLIVHLLSLSL